MGPVERMVRRLLAVTAIVTEAVRRALVDHDHCELCNGSLHTKQLDRSTMLRLRRQILQVDFCGELAMPLHLSRSTPI